MQQPEDAQVRPDDEAGLCRQSAADVAPGCRRAVATGLEHARGHQGEFGVAITLADVQDVDQALGNALGIGFAFAPCWVAAACLFEPQAQFRRNALVRAPGQRHQIDPSRCNAGARTPGGDAHQWLLGGDGHLRAAGGNGDMRASCGHRGLRLAHGQRALLPAAAPCTLPAASGVGALLCTAGMRTLLIPPWVWALVRAREIGIVLGLTGRRPLLRMRGPWALLGARAPATSLRAPRIGASAASILIACIRVPALHLAFQVPLGSDRVALSGRRLAVGQCGSIPDIVALEMIAAFAAPPQIAPAPAPGLTPAITTPLWVAAFTRSGLMTAFARRVLTFVLSLPRLGTTLRVAGGASRLCLRLWVSVFVGRGLPAARQPVRGASRLAPASSVDAILARGSRISPLRHGQMTCLVTKLRCAGRCVGRGIIHDACALAVPGGAPMARRARPAAGSRREAADQHRRHVLAVVSHRAGALPAHVDPQIALHEAYGDPVGSSCTALNPGGQDAGGVPLKPGDPATVRIFAPARQKDAVDTALDVVQRILEHVMKVDAVGGSRRDTRIH